MMNALSDEMRFADLAKLLARSGPHADDNNFGTIFDPPVPFEAMPEVLTFLRSTAHILVVGAGGLGIGPTLPWDRMCTRWRQCVLRQIKYAILPCPERLFLRRATHPPDQGVLCPTHCVGSVGTVSPLVRPRPPSEQLG